MVVNKVKDITTTPRKSQNIKGEEKEDRDSII